MTFGEYLNNCIDSRGISISNITKVSGINRGKLYNVFYGERTLTTEELFALIGNAGFSQPESEKLIDLYFAEFFGEAEFAKIKLLEKAFQSDNRSGTPVKYNFSDKTPSGAVSDKPALLTAVSFLLHHEKDVISNYSFGDKELDALVFDSTLNFDTKLTHICELSENTTDSENLEAIMSALKFMYNNSFPVYRYVNTEPKNRCGVFTHFFVGEKFALLFKDTSGIFITDEPSVKIIREKALAAVSECTPLGSRQDDIVYYSQIYDTALKSENASLFSIQHYPCILARAERDDLFSLGQDNLSEKEGLVDIAFNHYLKFSFANNSNILSAKGIEAFAETGNIQEIPDTYVKPASKKLRIKFLNKLVESIENNELFIADDSKFKIQPGFITESYGNNFLSMLGYDPENAHFFVAEKFISTLYDVSLVNTFKNLVCYLINAKKIYTKDFSTTYVKNLISKLEFFPEYGKE